MIKSIKLNSRSLSLVAILFFAAFGFLTAQEKSVEIPDSVSKDMAVNVTRSHIQHMQPIWTTVPQLKGRALTVGETHSLVDPESREMLGYVVDLEPTGFVIVPSDSKIAPIIAYSFRSDFPWEEDPDNLLLFMVREDLANRKRAIRELDDDYFEEINAMWRGIYYPDPTLVWINRRWPKEGTTITEGWVESTWHQRNPYNLLCPLDASTVSDPNVTDERSVVGCVATAMAQIVHYHADRTNLLREEDFDVNDQYTSQMFSDPEIDIDQDNSSHDFPSFTTLNGQMDNVADDYGSNTTIDGNDAAALCFACGVSVTMNYSSEGSGTATENIEDGLKDKFDYRQAEWMNGDANGFYSTLRRNMMAARPAAMAIRRPVGDVHAGHAIVCDGYHLVMIKWIFKIKWSSYHLNFGWGSGLPHDIVDAWYYLPTGMPANYDVVRGAVLKIKPPRRRICATGS